MENTTMTLGGLIEYYVRKQMKVTEFAKRIRCSRENANKLFKRSDFSIQLVHTISLALNHNFFIDLANDPQLAEIKEDVRTIKMKDLSEWLINFVLTTIHNIHCDDQDSEEFNDWAKALTRTEVELFVWDNSLLELKWDGIEDDDEITEEASVQFGLELVQKIIDGWYILNDVQTPKIWMKVSKEHLAKVEAKMNGLPEILKQEAVFNLQEELNNMEDAELCGKKIEIPVWVRPDCFPELVGKATIVFDENCNIVTFDFDTHESTL